MNRSPLTSQRRGVTDGLCCTISTPEFFRRLVEWATQLRPDFPQLTTLFTEVGLSMRRYAAAALFLITPPQVTPASAYNDPIGRGLMDLVNVLSAKVVPRDVVAWDRGFAPGTVVVSTRERRLHFVLGNKRAIQYGVRVGREGFTWSAPRR